MTQSNDYQRGYQSGRRKNKDEIDITQKERVYLACLALALEHCSGWRVDGKTINNVEGYCTLADVFAKNSISKIK